jgi:membrane protein YdbS with pleckstrin-like domain
MDLSNINIPTDLVFLWIAAVTVGAAVLVCLLPNIIHSAVALLFTLVGVAGLYLVPFRRLPRGHPDAGLYRRHHDAAPFAVFCRTGSTT